MAVEGETRGVRGEEARAAERSIGQWASENVLHRRPTAILDLASHAGGKAKT
jgi:hypothetical protein